MVQLKSQKISSIFDKQSPKFLPKHNRLCVLSKVNKNKVGFSDKDSFHDFFHEECPLADSSIDNQSNSLPAKKKTHIGDEKDVMRN